jgi:hypothetical protein
MSGCCDICIGPVLFAQGVTGLATCSQDYLSCNSQARSCLLKGLLVLQPSAAHRFTCLVNSRRGLAAQGITGLAALSSLTGLPILQTHGLAARLAHRQYVHGGLASGYASRISITGVFAAPSFADCVAMSCLDSLVSKAFLVRAIF